MNTPDIAAKLRDERKRGELAQQVLDNIVFRDAIERLRKRYIDAWQRAPLDNKDAQHFIRVMLAAHDSVVAEIENVMKTGQMATIELSKSNPFRARKARKGDDDTEN